MPCDTPYYPFQHKRYEKDHPKRHLAVPCGKCPDCKSRRINQWVFRLQQEDAISVSSYFVTLTFNTDHVPISKNGYMTTKKTIRKKNKKGEWKTYPHKKSISGFIKRLRKHDKNTKIRYYGVSEYGTKNNRPHHHIIIFNIKDVKSIYNSWSFGNIDIGSVSGASIAYTAKYLDKPPKDSIPKHARDDRVPEYQVQSRGLGKNYLKTGKEYHKVLDRMYVTQGKNKVALPRYYREKWYDQQQKDKISLLAQGYHKEYLLKKEEQYLEKKKIYPNITPESLEYERIKALENKKYSYYKQSKRKI